MRNTQFPPLAALLSTMGCFFQTSCREPATDEISNPDTGTEPVPLSDDGGLRDGGLRCPIDAAGFDNANSPYLGGEIAPEVVVDLYSDFQCSHCAAFQKLEQSLWQRPEYRDRVRLYYHHYIVHPSATEIHAASEAVFRQDPDAFWRLYAEIFTRLREDGDDMTLEEVLTFAETVLGLDRARLDADRVSEAVRGRLEQDKAFGKEAGVMGTPSLFVCGAKIDGVSSLEPTIAALLD